MPPVLAAAEHVWASRTAAGLSAEALLQLAERQTNLTMLPPSKRYTVIHGVQSFNGLINRLHLQQFSLRRNCVLQMLQ
jgi:hypothetical protein